MVELIVTMIVIGIMAIAIVPRMSLLQGFDEVGFRDQVKATLEYARKSAVAGRRDVRVTITGSAVTVERQNATPEGEGIAGFSALALPGSNDNQIVVPAGVTLSSSVSPLTFDPLGRSAGATITVGSATITVEAETGYVH